jgi:hypothetical protein
LNVSQRCVFGQEVTSKILLPGLLDPEEVMTLGDLDLCSPTLKWKNNASLHVTAAITDRVASPQWRDFSDFIALPSSSYITLYKALFFQLHHCRGLPSSSYITLYKALFFQLHHCTGLPYSSYITVQGSHLPVTSLYRASIFQLHHCTGLSSSSYITVQVSLIPVTSLYNYQMPYYYRADRTKPV